MPYITSIMMGLGLAMDAFAAAVSSGMSRFCCKLHHALATAFSYGFFQAAMTFLGYCTGSYFSKYISALDHWVAFILLAYIGTRAIISTIKDNDSGRPLPFNVKRLLLTSVATSIDALAAGVGLAFSEPHESENFIISCMIIGAITLALSFAGFYIGKYSGKILKKKVEIAGGIILILLGIKILLEHLLG